MLRCRKSGVLTGLPDGYGRGRIIGDYRRVALYGIRYLVRERELQFADLQPALERGEALEATLRLREELAEQRRALQQMQEMAARYGCDIAHPARTAREAVQWLYFAYLAAVKSQNGGAMSLGARPPSSTSISNAICGRVGSMNSRPRSSLTTSS